MNKIWLVLVAVGLLLVACGDSGSGANSTSEDKNSQNNQNVWDDADGVVKGVCNIHACDKASEGERLYVRSSGEIYQCKSGTWLDSKGKEFLEQEFIDCFIESLVQDSVKTLEDLKACTAQSEGKLSVVSGDLVACASKKWVEITSNVISESDLPDCSKKNFVYVLGKMAAYECKDGAWYVGEKKVVTSATATAKSSSSKAKESSSSPSSSSSAKPKSSSSVQVKDDGTKVRGVCQVSVSEVEKGELVKYSFVNMGGTVVTYSWNFGDNASEKKSDDYSPSVSYSRGGTYKAKLVINEGRDSESDEIVCPGVHVTGIQTTGCECSTDATALTIREGKTASATWTVSGCTGGSPYTYEWGGGASGTAASAQGTPEFAGRYAPTVTVTNNDGQIVEPVCKPVPVMGKISAECSFLGNLFYVRNITGISEEVPSIGVALVSAGRDPIEETLEASLNSRYSYDPENGYVREEYYDWSWFVKNIDVGNGTLSYSKYSLVYAGDTICSVSAVSCGPNTSVAHKGETASWNLQSVNYPAPTAETYAWTFMDKDGNVISTSSQASPEMTLSEYGIIQSTLVLDGGKATENTLVCSDLNIHPREITDCVCGTPELLTESDDLTEVDEVSYRWTVTGCTSEGAEPLTYTWQDGYAVDATDKTVVTRTFTVGGFYAPVVTVENKEGSIQDFACKRGVVKSESVQGLTYGGQVYRVVPIGSQVWMAENMSYDVSGSACFDNDPDNCEKYGRLYSAGQAQTVCPEGWHLPSQAEFEELLESVGGSFESLKAEEWGGEDTYGFSALPAGKNDVIAGEFTTWQFITGWWLQSNSGSYGSLYGVSEESYDGEVYYYSRSTSDNSENGFSVRCLMD